MVISPFVQTVIRRAALNYRILPAITPIGDRVPGALLTRPARHYSRCHLLCQLAMFGAIVDALQLSAGRHYYSKNLIPALAL